MIDPDGETIYAAGSTGILVIDAADLTKAGGLFEGTSIAALGLSPNGNTIFALETDSGEIVALDAASGSVIGRVPGDGFDRLLAVVPCSVPTERQATNPSSASTASAARWSPISSRMIAIA